MKKIEEKPVLLAIDVGNTNIIFGVFDRDYLKKTFRMTTKTERTSDGINITSLLMTNGVQVEDIEGIIIASVVPKIMHSFTNACIKYLKKILTLFQVFKSI